VTEKFVFQIVPVFRRREKLEKRWIVWKLEALVYIITLQQCWDKLLLTHLPIFCLQKGKSIEIHLTPSREMYRM